MTFMGRKNEKNNGNEEEMRKKVIPRVLKMIVWVEDTRLFFRDKTDNSRIY